MAEPRRNLPRIGRWLTGALFGAALLGLPVTVAMRHAGDTTATGMSKPRNALIVSQPARLSQLVNLTISQAVLHSGDGHPLPSDRLIRNVEIESPTFTLDLGPAPAGSEEAPVAADELTGVLSQLTTLNVGRVAVKRARLDVVRSDGSRLTLRDVAADIRAVARDSYTAKGTARLSGHLVAFDAAWSLPADPKRDSSYPLKLTIAGSLLEARFNGRLGFGTGPRLEGRSEIKSRKVRALARLFGLPVEAGSDLRHASVSGDMAWFNGLMAFPKASVTVDGNNATGVLSLRTGGSGPPKIEGTLAFSTFSIARYLETLAIGWSPAGKHRPLIGVIDADLRLSAEKVVAPRVETGRAALSLSVKDGKLQADVAELEIEGGSIGGQVTFEVGTSEPRLGVKLKATGIDPGRVFADALQRNPLLGRANIMVDATGSGTSLGQIGRSLTGRGTFQLADSGRLGLDLKALANVVLKSEATGWSTAGRGNTPLASLEARYQIANGGLLFESITAKSGNITYFGAGQVDVLHRLIDLHLAYGAATASEVPVTVREALRIRGPWSAPQFDMLPSPLSITAPTQRSGLAIRPTQELAAPAAHPDLDRAGARLSR